jgi:1-acyl-sn-glycerol-3-phosphate acyltransferase
MRSESSHLSTFMAQTTRKFTDIALVGYEYFAMVFGLSSLAILCLGGLPFAIVLACLPAKIRIPTGRRLISWVLTLYLWLLKVFCWVRIDSSALKSVRTDRPLIVVANHPSLLDAVILLSHLPHATCVMKASLRGNLLFGPMARLSGYISNENPMKLIKDACDELAAGAHVVIFPEGTRTQTFPVNTFSQTTALIASRSGLPIQTLFLKFNSNYLGKSWPLTRKPTLPLCIKVALGVKFDAVKDRLALTERLESYYRAHLND